MAKGDRRQERERQDSALIIDLTRFIGRFVVMSEAQKVVLSTYVIHTHLAESCQQTPYIFIHSPEPECGKSRLMEVMELLVARPWMIVNPSDAVLFRKVHADTPTLLWDEIDAVFAPRSAQYHEEQRGMLDQGHRRHGRVPRFIGDKVTEFRVYCPKVFAGIGTLPDTLSRRSIPISLKRRSPDEPVDEFILQDVTPEAEKLRARIEAWTSRHGEEAAATRPVGLPEAISDRMKEGCFSLFAIADRLGAGEELRKALEELLTGDRLDAAQTMRMRLLTDLRLIWAEDYRRAGKPRRFMSTDALLRRLYAFDESPWASYYGRGLEAKDVADLLRQYGLHPRLVNVKGERRRGYRRNPHNGEPGLADVWVRYLGGDETEVDPDAR
jgi:hypothetical protein